MLELVLSPYFFKIMTAKRTYHIGLQKLNRLTSNDQQDISYQKWVLAFNEAQYHWIENNYKLDEKNKHQIHKLQKILVPNKSILKSNSETLFDKYDFPTDYLRFSSSYTKIKECPFILENHLVESHNVHSLLKDEMWNPNLKFEETLITINSDSFNVYTNNKFKTEELILSYYREPVKINIKDNFTDIDDVITVDVDPEFDDINVHEIIDLAVHQLASDVSDEYRRSTIENHIQQTQIKI